MGYISLLKCSLFFHVQLGVLYASKNLRGLGQSAPITNTASQTPFYIRFSHNMQTSAYFLLGLSFIFLHELDAIRCKEWRILPGLSFLNDRVGYIVFAFAHIPLFYWIIVQTIEHSRSFMKGFDIFLMVHVVAHLLMLKHNRNEFRDWISWIIIVGAGAFGLVDLVMDQ